VADRCLELKELELRAMLALMEGVILEVMEGVILEVAACSASSPGPWTSSCWTAAEWRRLALTRIK
jgi:hypothetical protein